MFFLIADFFVFIFVFEFVTVGVKTGLIVAFGLFKGGV